MPKIGSVLFDKKFVFFDGGVGEKLFVVLNTPNNNIPYLVVKTTSRKVAWT